MLRKVTCLDTGESLWFQARTGYEAMRKLLYTLNLKCQDNDAVVNVTASCLHLFTIHCGQYWATRND